MVSSIVPLKIHGSCAEQFLDVSDITTTRTWGMQQHPLFLHSNVYMCILNASFSNISPSPRQTPAINERTRISAFYAFFLHKSDNRSLPLHKLARTILRYAAPQHMLPRMPMACCADTTQLPVLCMIDAHERCIPATTVEAEAASHLSPLGLRNYSAAVISDPCITRRCIT